MDSSTSPDPQDAVPPSACNLDFTDDIVLLENAIDKANEQLKKMSDEAQKFGLTINIDKTEAMLFNINDQDAKINLNGKQLNIVQDFKYLGAHMASTALDYEHRRGQAIGAFNKLSRIWKAAHVPIALKVNIFEASALSILFYGWESWIISPKLEAHINSFANGCYRSILELSRLNHVTNEEVLSRVGRPPLVNTIRKRQLGWLGHALRQSNDEPSKIFALYEPPHGSHRRGPHRLTYKKQMAKLLSDNPEDLTSKQLEEMADNKDKWGLIVAAYGRR